jgi:hypothetical protein
MRRGNDPEVLLIDGKFVGFNLSADYCSEHEWGIKKIDAAWSRNPETHKLIPNEEALKNLFFAVSKCGEYALLYFAHFYFYKRDKIPVNGANKKALLKFNNELHLSDLPTYRKPEEGDFKRSKIASAWDEDEFALLVKGKELVEKLQQVYEALKKGDAAIWLGGGQVFKNAGFCMAIYSLLPKEVIEQWKTVYEDRAKLNAASENTGILKKVKEAKLGYFALSPKWIEGFNLKGQETKHPVIYWLNPMDQDKNNYGWFTVEDLEDWTKGIGRIQKK